MMDGNPPERNAPIEFIVEGIPAPANPFDATEVDLQLRFLGPNGEAATVGGFWVQGYDARGLLPQGEAGWRARFTPTTPGEWQVSARLLPSAQTSNAFAFTVTDSSNPGFIRIDSANPRFFATDDGARFFPVGVNMGWWDDDPIENYTRWLDHFAANGGNTIRVWMANWSFAIEWNDTPLGDYRNRMQQAWLLDELFRIAAERGMKIILVLNHHGQFSRSTNPQWQGNPYNADLGGPLSSPEQFATDPVAIHLFQQRLRYIIDRWGAAPNLLAWEWWNEYNFTAIDDKLMSAWLDEMDKFLDSRDPYDHLVTISGPAGAASPIWQRPGIDFVSVHLYTTDDLLPIASELTQYYAPEVPEKPLWLAEFGFATGEETVESNDKTGIHLHNGLWATTFSGHVGTGMYWWWDTYIEPLDLWHHFGALTRFVEGQDLAMFSPAQLNITTENDQSPTAGGLLLEGQDAYLMWIRNEAYTAEAVEEAYLAAVREALRSKQIMGDFVYSPPPVIGHSALINGVEVGSYQVQWFDPQSGTWGEVAEVEAGEGTLTLPLPAFDKDIAAKITPRE